MPPEKTPKATGEYYAWAVEVTARLLGGIFQRRSPRCSLSELLGIDSSQIIVTPQSQDNPEALAQSVSHQCNQNGGVIGEGVVETTVTNDVVLSVEQPANVQPEVKSPQQEIIHVIDQEIEQG